MKLTRVQKRLAELRGDPDGVEAQARQGREWSAGERVMVSGVYHATVIGRDHRWQASYFVRVDALGTTKSVGAISIFGPEPGENMEIEPREY